MKSISIRHSIFISLLTLMVCDRLSSQNFTWMKGSNLNNPAAIHGTLGITTSSNDPGSRLYQASWSDSQGNLWVYGGAYAFGSLSDLWKYDISNNNWTWMQGSQLQNQPAVYGTLGVSSQANSPGFRSGAITWTDASDNLWLLGGSTSSFSLALLNDLWKYNPTTNQWTWMSGASSYNQTGVYGTQGLSSPGNVPGARAWGASWMDNTGDLWLFGGTGLSTIPGNSNTLGDLWKYSVSTNQWTWMQGSSSLMQLGQYGTQGIASPTNMPGNRDNSTYWKDLSGNFWMMGGWGNSAITNNSYLNDLWKYDVGSNQWTWVSGSTLHSQAGNYGTLYVPSSGNVPGARQGAFGWVDAPTGNFFIFGGRGYGSSSNNPNCLSDLWKYTPTTHQWTWMKGPSSPFQAATYGIQGTSSPFNIPGSRYVFSGWIDGAHNFWIYGGYGLTNQNSMAALGDVWKYQNCSPTLTVTGSANPICSGKNVTLTASGTNSYSWSTSQNGANITVTPNDTTWYYVTGTNTLGCSITIPYLQLVIPSPSLHFVNPSFKPFICAGETLILTVGGATSYSWHTANSNTSAVITDTPLQTTGYTVTGTNTNGCSTTGTYIQNVAQLPAVSLSTTDSLMCAGSGVTLTAYGASGYAWQNSTTQTSATLFVTPSQTTTYTVSGISSQSCVSSATITQLVISCVGIEKENQNPSFFAIYPNPNTGSFKIKLESAQIENSELVFFNVLGQTVYTQKIEEGEQELNLSLAKGIYHLVLKNSKGEKIRQKRMILE